MFDANGVVCTDIHKASLEILSRQEIERMSVCKITSTIVFDINGPRKGGLHDPAMGSLDTRIPCSTCGCRRDCPGHLGHIELPLPAFHPTLLSSLVRLLKTFCFRCRRLRIDPRSASVFVKKFQLTQHSMLSDLEHFGQLHGKLMKDRRGEGDGRAEAVGGNITTSAAKRVELIKLFTKLQNTQAAQGKSGNSLSADISATHTSVEAWSTLRSMFFKAAISKPNCSHCGRSFKTAIKQAPLGAGIDISWPWGSEKPFGKSTWKQIMGDGSENTASKDNDSDFENDEETMTHGKRGKVVGSLHFQGYQLVNLLQAVWKSPDRSLLEFLYPMSIKNGWEMFFIRFLPVSANKFRPLMKGTSMADGEGSGSLHNRTSSLVDILAIIEKMVFALGVLRNPDPQAALMDPDMAKDPTGVPLPSITEADKAKLKKIIDQHQGNFKLLSNYSRDLQTAINSYIDSTKAQQQRGKVAPPGVRQWMERKQGAIRQKMMGKRVNFAARTVIAPDNCINTNEIGIPVEFARKLTIQEYVTPQSVEYLRLLVQNGSHTYPGANMIEDTDGRVFDLSVMGDAQRQSHARLLEADSVPGSAPKIIYRHVRDGDVVVMNRQPTLHRASMMAHFVRVLQGWKTFRMMYVNCGSYNADFDGDEMNMHLPQDPCARAEAQQILNSDCHYITAKNGEPLRGLIQDHVLGGNFLTCRDCFLDANQYYTLLYSGMSSFIDRGSSLVLSASQERGHASNVAVTARGLKVTGDPFFSILLPDNLPMVVEPPVIFKPKRLWTGKQVITGIFKTLVDKIARNVFKDDAEFMADYAGLNFTGKSKTPGDSWGGVLDGDKEEATLIIRNSELLQGVFDKAMFGASSFGIVHLCFDMLGPRVAGVLLSVFAKVFTCYLQMRGFSCSTGDFYMKPEGERKREQMILQCIIAGNYLQEVFVDSLNRQMQWRDGLANRNSLQRKLEAAYKVLPGGKKNHQSNDYSKNCLAKLSETAALDFRMDVTGFIVKGPDGKSDEGTMKISPAHIPQTYGLDYSRPLKHTSCDDDQMKDIKQWQQQRDGDETLETDEYPEKVKIESAEKAHLISFNPAQLDQSNPWDIARHLHAPLPLSDWRSMGPDKVMGQLRELLESLRSIGNTNNRLRYSVLEQLSKSPELAIYFPRVARMLGADMLWGTNLPARLLRDTFTLPTPAPPGRIGPPRPNSTCILPGGNVVVGDGSLRLPTLYHPSWVFEDKTGMPFEDSKRYAMQMVTVRDQKELEQYKNSTGSQPFCPRPNELTRIRFELLARNHFAGKEDVLFKMVDGFFQSGMGKLTSKNNDLVSGNTTLYSFPSNGFSSMITTGAKGSKVNYAMICGMLSQQSLEGRRVPVMVSGKTLPSFARYDLGARAGGLITDRYLTGLRPQEYFFHCMAGREGLVDTAVKTARSGYLQRCVMKGMEGVIIQYDGTARDSDGTIVQFLYGEDGLDVAKSSYCSRMEDLLQNLPILKAKYGTTRKLQHKQVASSFKEIEAFLERQQIAEAREFEEVKTGLGTCVADTDPINNVLPPAGYVGSSSEKFRKQIMKIVDADPHNFTAKLAQSCRRREIDRHVKTEPPGVKKAKITSAEMDSSRKFLEKMLSVKFSEMLCVPGEGVGCLSAQSMGEPATQMTLNTFHLAGHGAANVTLGIPRLREILQTAGNSKTPFLYIPIRGTTLDETARNADTALLGFKKILLTDIVHAVGVEANVFHQPLKCNKGLPEYNLSIYKDNVNDVLAPKFFWQYESTIQFENLDHFCKVVPKFTPQKIFAFTISRVVREMMRQVNKLLYLYSTKYAEEEIDSDFDELEIAADRFVFNRSVRTHFTRRDRRRERARNAGVGFGTKTGTDLGGGDTDLMTSVDVGEVYKRKPGGKEDKDTAPDDKEEEHDDGAENSDALPDSAHSKDDSEEDFSESEMGDDAKKEEDEESTAGDHAVAVGEKSDADEDSENDMNDVADQEMKDRREELLQRQEARRKARALTSRWKEINLEFDKVLRVMPTEKLLEPYGEELEPEAMWSDMEGGTMWKVKQLPSEAFRFLTDLKICRKTWRIVLKFGWPLEKCPRRIVLLDPFVKIIKKYVLQDTPGVGNPRIVGGDSTETGAQCELQCEGANFGWIHRLKDTCVDHNKLTSNDIRSVLQFYGVEACRLVIIRELTRVFSVYGIVVDYRHMSLIADEMTHSGLFRSFSRLGIRHHSSPFLQMSFETSMKFLTEAIERGAYDDLRTPAGAIVTGKLPPVGSGMCRILSKISLGRSQQQKRSDRQAAQKLAIVQEEKSQESELVKSEFSSVIESKKRPMQGERKSKKKLKFIFG